MFARETFVKNILEKLIDGSLSENCGIACEIPNRQEDTVVVLETQGSTDEIAAASVNDVPHLEEIVVLLFYYKFKLSNDSSNDIEQYI